MGLQVTFWGVRGTVPCPSREHLAYGGNTSCVQVRVGDSHIILDAGTGIRRLGQDLLRQGVERATLLFTHAHHDHINGFPFFAPAFRPKWRGRVMCGSIARKGGIQGALTSYMAAPLFPLPLRKVPAALEFVDFRAGEAFDDESGARVRTCLLNHPDGATAYRIDHEGASVAYVTDHEHVPGRPDERVLELIQGCDLVIYDATYTDDEFPSRVGWGHSTWSEGIRVCRAAGAKRLALFHHDPAHDDVRMVSIEAEARAEWDAVFAAREGLTVSLG